MKKPQQKPAAVAPLFRSTPLKISSSAEKEWQNVIFNMAAGSPALRKIRQKGQQPTIDDLLNSEKPLIGDLWRTFTQERSELGLKLLNTKSYALAYLLGFHLPNYARMQITLTRLAKRTQLANLFKSHPQIQLADFGCGTGAMTHSLLNFLNDSFRIKATTSVLYDLHRHLLDIAKEFAEPYSEKTITIRTSIDNIKTEKLLPPDHQLPTQTVQFFTFGYIWNELQKNKRAQHVILNLLKTWASASTPCCVIFLEPANQNICRSAMSLRDVLVDSHWDALYPCPQGAQSCPMLQRTRDWCYSEGLFNMPAIVKKVDQFLELDRRQINGTFFVFGNKAFAEQVTSKASPLPKEVCVGRPLKADSHKNDRDFTYLVCNGKNLLSKDSDQLGKKRILRGESL